MHCRTCDMSEAIMSEIVEGGRGVVGERPFGLGGRQHSGSPQSLVRPGV